MKDQLTVLVVDDNEINRRLLAIKLEKEGYQTLSAGDGAEALDLVRKFPIDLVLLDVMMPVLDGFEVLKTLRRLYSPEELPIIMATAKGQSPDVVKAFGLGASDYVVKPLDLPVVAARVRAQLRHHTPRTVPKAVTAGHDIGVGTVIEGKYRLEEEIGRGNFGAVFRGTHLQLKMPVAVKVLRTSSLEREDSIERFRREGISTCRLQHHNAVSVLDLNVTVEGLPYLVMELLNGHTLEDEIKEQGKISPYRTAQILLPVCEVLAEAHALGIIHRDVKPQNIFLHQTARGEVVKVLDFGIAKLVSGDERDPKLTHEGGFPGTPAYMAPERFNDESYDGRCDVYSLGIVLYEMLVGTLPFIERSPVRLIMRQINEKPRRPRELAPELSDALEIVILQALAKDWHQRPTIEQLAQRLAAATGCEDPATISGAIPTMLPAPKALPELPSESAQRSRR